MIHVQLFPRVEQEISFVVEVGRAVGVGQHELPGLESYDVQAIRMEYGERFFRFAFALFASEGQIFDGGTDGCEEAGFREIIRKKLVGQLVDGKQYGYVAFAEYVAQNHFVVLFGEVLVEKCFGLVVFIQFERHGGVSWRVDKYVGFEAGVFQFFRPIQKFLYVGRHRMLGIHVERAEKDVASVAGRIGCKRKAVRAQADGERAAFRNVEVSHLIVCRFAGFV